MNQETNYLLQSLILGFYCFFGELYIALNLTMFNCQKRKYYYVKLFTFAILAIPFYFLPDISFGLFNIDYIIILFYCFIAGLFLYKEPILKQMLFLFSAFGIQHISWNIEMIFFTILPENVSLTIILMIYILTYLVCYGLIAFIFFFLLKKQIYGSTHWPSAITCIFLILLTYFLSAYLSGINAYTIATRIYDILACLFALLIHFGLNVLFNYMNEKKLIENENLILEKHLEFKSQQQNFTKETMNILDTNIHEIRRELNKLLTLTTQEEKTEIIKKVSKTLNIYSNFSKCGDENLDLILIESSIICDKNNIDFTYLVNPISLSFMNKNDIISLFGNLIDNAIEASIKTNKENRLIRLNVNEKNSFISIHLENYCSEVTTFNKHGLPLTSKQNKSIHGFGTRIIKAIVDKYAGNAKFQIINNMFLTDILIPKKNLSEEKITN